MDAILMFKEAAKALQQDPRFLKLVAARKANDDNGQLQEMIGEFNLIRLELNNELEKSPQNDDKLKELNSRINDLYSDIMEENTMIDFNEAKEEMKGVISHINAIVTAAVDGEDPMQVHEPVAGGCGEEGCSSCSGCG